MASFRTQVESLVGKRVRLGRGGPDERKGTLVAVQSEYLTVDSEDGARVHYPMHHLKSVTELMETDDGDDESRSRSWYSEPDPVGDLPSTFAELMNSFLGLKVQVYDHGPESAAGFVFEVGDDFVKLVTSPDEMVHYPFFHIRSVRLSRPQNGGGSGRGSGQKSDDGASSFRFDSGSGQGSGRGGSGQGSGHGSRGKSDGGSRRRRSRRRGHS